MSTENSVMAMFRPRVEYGHDDDDYDSSSSSSDDDDDNNNNRAMSFQGRLQQGAKAHPILRARVG
jgi:hypothetical protein